MFNRICWVTNKSFKILLLSCRNSLTSHKLIIKVPHANNNAHYLFYDLYVLSLDSGFWFRFLKLCNGFCLFYGLKV